MHGLELVLKRVEPSTFLRRVEVIGRHGVASQNLTPLLGKGRLRYRLRSNLCIDDQ